MDSKIEKIKKDATRVRRRHNIMIAAASLIGFGVSLVLPVQKYLGNWEGGWIHALSVLLIWIVLHVWYLIDVIEKRKIKKFIQSNELETREILKEHMDRALNNKKDGN